MTISEITSYLESISPLSLQEDYDNCGLLVGDAGKDFQKALLCLDLTEKVMDEAIKNRCNLVISHHPFIFKGLKRLTPEMDETAIIKMALFNDIAIYAMHTNLDNTLHGLNAFVFSKLGITRFSILSPKQGLLVKLVVFCPVAYAGKVRNALFEAGVGHVGHYDCCSYNVEGEGTFRASEQANPFVGEKHKIHQEREIRIEVIFPRHIEMKVMKALRANHPYEEIAFDIYPLDNLHAQSGAGIVGDLEVPMPEPEFLQLVKNNLELAVIRHSELSSKSIRRIALCTGSGNFLIPEAVRLGADAYLTADLKYHDFFSVGRRLLLLDIGHYESEHGVKEWLYAELIEKFPNFAFLISEVNTNPVHYF
ncbi:MAG: Nif3-like dinuclear metal center hexameric protein [Bacteroidota bacterium]